MERKETESSLLYVIKLIAFVLMLVFVGNVIASLWRYIGHTLEGAILSEKSEKIPYTLIIDAGHGGEDGGAVALSKIPEKHLNFDVSVMLCEMLRSYGINAVLTRESDEMLTCDEGKTKKGKDLASRRKFAESYENAIFVSIHMNSFSLPEYRGLQVYYSKNNEHSKMLADTLQNYTKEYIDNANERKTKSGEGIYLLEKLNCPSVLVECGFLSNPEEAALLNTESYRKKLAFVICNAICDFLSETSD